MTKGRLAAAISGQRSGDLITSVYSDVGPEKERRWQGRIQQESGPVETHYLPEAFRWFGLQEQRLTGREMVVALQGSEFRVFSTPARLLFPEEERDGELYVEIGIAPKAFAIRRSTQRNGILCRIPSKRSPTVYFSCRKAAERLKAEGWPVPGQYPVVWDAEHQMLVAKKPGGVSGD